MARLIGTAGHVDHGKTSLILALTGIDADRLPEEKKRGMTIDIGFSRIDLPKSGRVSIVDVPGHERFLTNMLVGALGIDVALLCVAADDGVKPQTREHLAFLELLHVDKMVVALTRSDLADDDTRALARMEVEELLAKTRFDGSPVVEVSSTTREGLLLLTDLLDEAASSSPPKRSGPWYLPVDRAFSMKGHGAVVTGTLANDSVSVGDEAILFPGDKSIRIRGIESHGASIERAEPGMRVALNLSGVKTEELNRGQIVGRPGAIVESSILDAQVRRVSEIRHGSRIRVSIGAAEAIGKVFLNDFDESLVQLRLESSVACLIGQPLIIRAYSPPTLLAGGTVLIAEARKRRKNAEESIKAAVDDLEMSLLNTLHGKVWGVKTEEICRLIGRSPQDLGQSFEALSEKGEVVGLAGLWFDATSYAVAREKFLAALAKLHTDHPMVGEHARDAVLKEIGRTSWSGKPLDRWVQKLATDGFIEAQGAMVKLSSFELQLNPKQRAFLDRVKAEYLVRGINSPSSHDLTSILHVPPQAIEEIVRLGVAAGEMAAIGEGIVYVKAWLEEFRANMVDRFGLEPFTAGEFRDIFESSRKYVIPLLEHFDAQGFTVRVGDRRAIRRLDS